MFVTAIRKEKKNVVVFSRQFHLHQMDLWKMFLNPRRSPVFAGSRSTLRSYRAWVGTIVLAWLFRSVCFDICVYGVVAYLVVSNHREIQNKLAEVLLPRALHKVAIG